MISQYRILLVSTYLYRRLGLPDSQSLHLLRQDLPFSTLPITSSGNDREGTDGAGIPIIPSRHGAGEIGSHGSDVGNMNGNQYSMISI